ncbi:MAG: peptidylprolyl isomerase [Actinomycetota bacterium]
MIRSRLRLRTFIVLVVVPMVLAACDGSGAPAASVGDAQISHEQLASDVSAFRFLAGLSGAPCGSPVQGETQDAACARFALTNDIQEEFVKTYALTNDLAVPDADVTDAIAQLETNLGGADQLEAQLSGEGLTRNDLELLAARLLLFGEVQGAIVADRLDDSALMEIYEQDKPQFTTVEVHHILLETQEAAEDVAAEATPENFARLARTRSVDPGSAPSGGSLGSYSEQQFRSQFDPTFVEASLALEPGDVSGVVETTFGFHVIYLARRDVASFDEVREQLSAQQGAQVFQAWLDEQYGEVDVEVNPRYGRLDVVTGEVVAVRSTEDGVVTQTIPPSPVP